MLDNDPGGGSKVAVLAKLLSKDADRAGGGPGEAADAPHQCRFAASVGTDKAIDDGALKTGRYPIQNFLFTIPLFQLLY